jgi:hypothetical protein
MSRSTRDGISRPERAERDNSMRASPRTAARGTAARGPGEQAAASRAGRTIAAAGLIGSATLSIPLTAALAMPGSAAVPAPGPAILTAHDVFGPGTQFRAYTAVRPAAAQPEGPGGTAGSQDLPIYRQSQRHLKQLRQARSNAPQPRAAAGRGRSGHADGQPVTATLTAYTTPDGAVSGPSPVPSGNPSPLPSGSPSAVPSASPPPVPSAVPSGGSVGTGGAGVTSSRAVVDNGGPFVPASGAPTPAGGAPPSPRASAAPQPRPHHGHRHDRWVYQPPRDPRDVRSGGQATAPRAARGPAAGGAAHGYGPPATTMTSGAGHAFGTAPGMRPPGNMVTPGPTSTPVPAPPTSTAAPAPAVAPGVAPISPVPVSDTNGNALGSVLINQTTGSAVLVSPAGTPLGTVQSDPLTGSLLIVGTSGAVLGGLGVNPASGTIVLVGAAAPIPVVSPPAQFATGTPVQPTFPVPPNATDPVLNDPVLSGLASSLGSQGHASASDLPAGSYRVASLGFVPPPSADTAVAPSMGVPIAQNQPSTQGQILNQLVPDPGTPPVADGIYPNQIPANGGSIPGGTRIVAGGVTYNIPYDPAQPIQATTVPTTTGGVQADPGQTIILPPGTQLNLGSTSTYIPGNRDLLQLPDGTYYVGLPPAPGQPDTRTQVIIQTTPLPGAPDPGSPAPGQQTPPGTQTPQGTPGQQGTAGQQGAAPADGAAIPATPDPAASATPAMTAATDPSQTATPSALSPVPASQTPAPLTPPVVTPQMLSPAPVAAPAPAPVSPPPVVLAGGFGGSGSA